MFKRLLLACSALILFTACTTPPPALPAVTYPSLKMSQTPRGVRIVLPDTVLFRFNSSVFNTADGGPYMDRVAKLLLERTPNNLEIEGHTDNIGSHEFNLRLSEMRAGAIRRELLARNVPGWRMQTKGLAHTQPIAPNDTETGRQLNRRSVLIIVGEKLDNLRMEELPRAYQ